VGEVVLFSEAKCQRKRELDEDLVTGELLDLFWTNPLWFVEYTEYCHSPHDHSICQENYDYLVEHDLLLADMSVPNLAYSVVCKSTGVVAI
jgi:hypothetical protein